MQPKPIHIVTGTYLQWETYRRRYQNIWLWLGFLYTIQWFHWMHLIKQTKKQQQVIQDWIEKYQLTWEQIHPKMRLIWTPFQMDLLPLSVHTFLKDIAQQVENPSKLIVMGSSFPIHSIPNLLPPFSHTLSKEKKQDLIRLYQPLYTFPSIWNSLEEIEDKINKQLQSWQENYLSMYKQKEDEPKNTLTYQQFESLTTPIWKSRFIEQQEPNNTEEEEQQEWPYIEEEQLETNNQIEDEEEQEHEFEQFIFHDFLEQIPSHKSQFTTPFEKVHYILQDIERDREQIIRRAIKSLQT